MKQKCGVVRTRAERICSWSSFSASLERRVINLSLRRATAKFVARDTTPTMHGISDYKWAEARAPWPGLKRKNVAGVQRQ
jgi:predicted Fe-S protein YdhL (DUF1289 family)